MKIEQIWPAEPKKFDPKHLKLTFERRMDIQEFTDLLYAVSKLDELTEFQLQIVADMRSVIKSL